MDGNVFVYQNSASGIGAQRRNQAASLARSLKRLAWTIQTRISSPVYWSITRLHAGAVKATGQVSMRRGSRRARLYAEDVDLAGYQTGRSRRTPLK